MGRGGLIVYIVLFVSNGSVVWIGMRDRDDSIVSSPHDFCASLSSFYSDLFSTSLVDPHIQADLLENLSSSLSDDQSSL